MDKLQIILSLKHVKINFFKSSRCLFLLKYIVINQTSFKINETRACSRQLLGRSDDTIIVMRFKKKKKKQQKNLNILFIPT